MIRIYCDVCDKEIDRDFVAQRLVREWGIVTVEVTVTINNVWNDGNICKECLERAFCEGKDRDK